MITLVIDNSVCQLLNLPTAEWRALRKLLSYNIDSQAAYFSSAHATKRYLFSRRGEFPTGLLYLVEEYLQRTKLSVRKEDRRRRPEAITDAFELRLDLSPYPEQLEAPKACKREGRGIVVAPTGVGKSVIVALIINELRVKTLVVVPTLELKRQLSASLKAAFPKGYELIKVQNIDSVKPSDSKGVDCVIIDEFHHSGAKTYRDLNRKHWNGIYYKFGLTATPFRSRDEERLLLESVLSKVIYAIDYKSAVYKGYIVPLEAYYYELPAREIVGNEMSWPSMYSELVVNRDDRNNLIALLLCRLNAQGVSTLCLVNEIKHGNTLSELTGLPFANGEADNTAELIREFNAGKIKCLIGTSGVLGEGVDTKPAEFTVIAGLGKAKTRFMQQCGRCFRKFTAKESGKVILFKDKSHKWTLAHFNAQVKYLRDEYGIKPIKLEVSDGKE